MKRILLLASIILTIWSCQTPAPEQKPAPKVTDTTAADSSKIKRTPPALVLDHTFHDVACVLAGQMVDSTSKNYQVTQTERFEKYSIEHEEQFKKYMDSKIKNLRSWADEQLELDRASCDTVLYPFSGPDFTYLFNMYPSAHTYYMFGLEPVGIVPEIP
ncbi:MAG: hypothetical protein ACKO6L_09770, partial [Flavobacteriales bacterium]